MDPNISQKPKERGSNDPFFGGLRSIGSDWPVHIMFVNESASDLLKNLEFLSAGQNRSNIEFRNFQSQ